MLLPKRALGSAVLLAFSLCIGSTAHAQAGAQPPAIEHFFQRPVFGKVVLSPTAKYLAVRASAPDRNDYLVVIDLATNTPNVVAAYNDSDINDFHWINDERLVFDVTDKNQAQGNARHAPGLFAVNRDGSQLLQLASRQGAGDHGSKSIGMGRKLLPRNTALLPQLPGKTEYVYVQTAQFDTKGELRHVDLMRLNTLTGQTQAVSRPGAVKGWMLDHTGEPRLATWIEENTANLLYRDPATSAWRTIASFPVYGAGADHIDPVGFGPDGSLYVTLRNGKDTTALYTFNLATGKVNPEPLVVTSGYDFSGGLVRNRDKVLGVAITTDATAMEWFDPGMKALQQTLDKLLPTTINLISVPAAMESPWVLVMSYSDAVPVVYNLYNTKTGALNNVGSAKPTINPAQMARQQAVSYKARDGLTIPALLTLPRTAKKNLPLVLLIHGGPYMRGATWGWHPETQFLASRGYAVLEPSFRGTTGFGEAHYRAGWKQWGLAMQNDMADGARWAIAQGIADPKRICIAGASYGGYATLMGLVNDPDLYQCGVNWVGVTDINLMYNDSWSFTSDFSDEWKKYGMPDLIGDRVKDAAQLKATSPIEQAARIRQPLLMAYGGVDRRVPMHHGKKFLDAVQRNNQNVEWIEYPDEAHGWYLPKNNIDFWGRVEKFLDKNIGGAAAPVR